MRLLPRGTAGSFAGLAVLALVPIAPALAAEPVVANASARAAPAAAAARVSRLLLANGNLLAMYQIVSGQNQCFVYTYDHNGNRLTRSNLNPGPGAMWGSAVYGCYNWATP